MTTYRRILLRRDSALNWSSSNPALRQGELGVDLDAKKFKLGDGFTSWNNLPYMNDSQLQTIRDEYGDETSFNLWFDLTKI